mmetsp:Transcript_3591/g.10123  ORF Transcript_3591/g.10123 Transcript_3591/m.10123 type:complete len:210 (-) Transcript_3591:671-1300(-)
MSMPMPILLLSIFSRNNDHLSSECLFRFLVLAYSFINASMSDETFLANTKRTQPNPTQPNQITNCSIVANSLGISNRMICSTETERIPRQCNNTLIIIVLWQHAHTISSIVCAVASFSSLLCSVLSSLCLIVSCHVVSCRVIPEHAVLKRKEEREREWVLKGSSSREALERATIAKMKNVTGADQDVCISVLRDHGYDVEESIEAYLDR